MASVLFDESDFEADFGTGKGDEEEQYEEEAPCLRSDCVAAREDLDRLTSAAPTTIRLRILRVSEWVLGGICRKYVVYVAKMIICSKDW